MPQPQNIKELKINKFFSDVNESVINSIYKPENLKVVNEGDIIYKSGDHSDELFLLLRGEVKIKFPSHNYISNKVFNDFFGEKELSDNTRRHSSAIANNNCLLYIIKKHIFEALIDKSKIIKKNLDTFGEVKIPEVTSSEKSRIDIAKSIKPRLFRVIRSREEDKPEDKGDSATEDFVKIDNSNIQLDDPSINLENEIIIDEQQPETTATKDKDARKMFEEVGALLEEDESVRHKSIDSTEIKRLLDVLSFINSNFNLYDTSSSIVEELLNYTSSDAGEVFLFDKKSAVLKKFVDKNGSISSIQFKNSEGLTGACALQSKTINFEEPQKDSRFVAEIDQPGNSNLKKIVYLPLLGQNQEMVGVLQLARKSDVFTEINIQHLELITKHAAIAIERCDALEKLIELENQKSRAGIEDFLKENLLIPIKVINSYTTHLSKGSFSKKIREMISLINIQTNFIWDIFLSVFSYNKTDFKVNTELLSINDYMNSIAEVLSDYCASRNIHLFKKTGDDAGILADAGKLFMAIFQLIENACNVSEEGGKVFISSFTDGDYVQINVMDAGPGVPDEFKDSLFTPGFSNDKGRNRFGLPIAKRIIELHSGQLNHLKNTKVGTTFSIRIPIIKKTDELQWDNTTESDSVSNELNKD